MIEFDIDHDYYVFSLNFNYLSLNFSFIASLLSYFMNKLN